MRCLPRRGAGQPVRVLIVTDGGIVAHTISSLVDGRVGIAPRFRAFTGGFTTMGHNRPTLRRRYGLRLGIASSRPVMKVRCTPGLLRRHGIWRIVSRRWLAACASASGRALPLLARIALPRASDQSCDGSCAAAWMELAAAACAMLTPARAPRVPDWRNGRFSPVVSTAASNRMPSVKI